MFLPVLKVALTSSFVIFLKKDTLTYIDTICQTKRLPVCKDLQTWHKRASCNQLFSIYSKIQWESASCS